MTRSSVGYDLHASLTRFSTPLHLHAGWALVASRRHVHNSQLRQVMLILTNPYSIIPVQRARAPERTFSSWNSSEQIIFGGIDFGCHCRDGRRCVRRLSVF